MEQQLDQAKSMAKMNKKFGYDVYASAFGRPLSATADQLTMATTGPVTTRQTGGMKTETMVLIGGGAVLALGLLVLAVRK